MRLESVEKWKLAWVYATRGDNFLVRATKVAWPHLSAGMRGEEVPDAEGKLISEWLREFVRDEVAEAPKARTGT